MNKFFLLATFVVGFFLCVLIPPFQKPDEYVHFHKSLAIAAGHLDCSKSTGNSIDLPQGYINLEDEIRKYGLEHHDFAKFPFRLYQQPLFMSTSEQKTAKLTIDDTCGWPTIAYIPQALVLKLAEIIKLNGYYAFFAGRIFMFAFAYFWFLALYKKTAYKSILLLFISLPIVLHQLGSYGYDVIHLLLSLTIFTYLFDLRSRRILTLLEVSKFALLLSFMVVAKSGYEPFLLLIFLLPWRKLRLENLKLGVLLIILALTLTTWHLKTAFFDVGRVTSSMQLTYTFPNLQLKYSISHPSFLWHVFSQTTSRTFEEYAKQMVGKFGWLDYWLTPYLYPLYFIFVGYVISHFSLKWKEKLSLTEIIFLGVWIVLQYFWILFSLYLVWNSVGSEYVEGVQGRYFLALIPFFIYALVSVLSHPRLRNIVTIFLIAIVGLSIVKSTLKRYYDYSNLFQESTLTISKTDVARSLSNPLEVKLDVSKYENSKIGGLSIAMRNPGYTVNHPHLISIKDSSCSKTYREQFIALDRVEDGIYNATFKPLHVNSRTFCVVITPYQDNPGVPLEIFYDGDNNPLIEPLVLR